MSFLSGIGHFFTSLFGNKGALAQKLLHEVGSFVNLAEPIILEIETEIKALPDQGKSIQAIETFLAKYEPDVSKISGIAASLAGLPAADLWHNLAVLALQTFAPKGTPTSLLSLAVEFEYNLFKQSKTAPAGPAATPVPAAA